MPIQDLCSKSLVYLNQTSTLKEAVSLMKENNIGCVVVTEGDGQTKALGIVTDRDIALALGEGRDKDSQLLTIMSDSLISVKSTQGIAEVIDKMEQEGVRRILVVDASGQPCGVVSTDDLLQLIAREVYSLGRLVQKQSTGPTLIQKM